MKFIVKNLSRIVLILGLLVIIVMVMFPPYYGGKQPFSEGLHANIGYFPLWDPPAVEDAYQFLHKKPVDNTADLDSYVVGLNKVRLIINSIIVILSTAMLYIISRVIKKRCS